MESISHERLANVHSFFSWLQTSKLSKHTLLVIHSPLECTDRTGELNPKRDRSRIVRFEIARSKTVACRTGQNVFQILARDSICGVIIQRIATVGTKIKILVYVTVGIDDGDVDGLIRLIQCHSR